MKRQRVRRELEGVGDAAGGHALRPGLHQQAEDIEAIVLGEGGQGRDGIGLFHISTNDDAKSLNHGHEQRPADRLAIAVAQLNPIVGDVAGNLERARSARAQAARDGADIVAFSELFIAGYPPEDLVLKPAFQAACRAAIEALARDTADGGPAVLIGTPWVEDGKLYNAYALLDGGRIEAIRFKVDLPNYGVFDEKRVFAAGPLPGPVDYPRRAARRCRSARTSGRLGRLRERRRMPGRDRRRNPDRAERLAVLARQDRCAAQRRGGARHRERVCR